MIKILFYSIIYLFLTCNSVFAQSVRQTTYENENYTINFPGQFEKKTTPLASNVGQLIMTSFSYEPKSSDKDSNYVYMLLDSDYPDSIINSDKKEILDKFFESSISGAVKNVNGKLISVTKGMTGIYPNRTVEMDFQNGLAIFKMTIILRKNKLIIVQTITNTQNYPNSAANAFLDSFKLK